MKPDEKAARSKLYGEIMQFARGGMAKKLKSKYAPKPLPKAPDESVMPSPEGLSPEALSTLEAALGAHAAAHGGGHDEPDKA